MIFYFLYGNTFTKRTGTLRVYGSVSQSRYGVKERKTGLNIEGRSLVRSPVDEGRSVGRSKFDEGSDEVFGQAAMS